MTNRYESSTNKEDTVNLKANSSESATASNSQGDDPVRAVERVLRAVSPATRPLIRRLLPNPLHSGSVAAAEALTLQVGGMA
jgi:hypothetical protein